MKIDYMKHSKKFFILSILLVVIALAATLFIRPATGIDVQGGTRITYTYTGELSAAYVQTAIGSDASVRFGTVVQSSTLEKGQSTMTIITAGGSAETAPALTGVLQNLHPAASIEEVSRNTIQPRSSKSLYLNMAIAMGVIAMLLLGFAAFRFRKIGGWATGITLLKVMLFSMIVLVGVYSLFGIPLDTSAFAFVAATGTLSLAGAILMLDDGIRGKTVALRTAETLNATINERSVPLLITGAFAVLALVGGMIVGRGLSFLPMIVGILLTLFSSCFVAVPLWAMFSKKYQAE